MTYPPAASTGLERTVDQPRRRILFVDDDEAIRDLFAREMRERGLAVDQAGNAAAAFRLAARHTYDAVVVDHHLPDLDACAVVRRVRQLLPDTFFVMVTGLDVDLRLDRGCEGSVAAVIRKPWSAAALGRAVRLALRLRAERLAPGTDRDLEILLIADDPAIAEVVRRRLASETMGGCTVQQVERPSDGLGKLTIADTDCVVVDLSLAGATPLGIVKRIRMAALGTALIVLGPTADGPLAREAIRLCADEYLATAQLDSPLLEQAIRYGIERQRSEQSLRHRAHYDQLTGVANRTLFLERLTHAVASAHRSGRPCALLLLDLDRFQSVNDRLGDEAGDIVLRETAVRLRGVVREPDTVARLGGDVFSIVLDGTDDDAVGANIAGRVSAAVAAPIPVDGQTVAVNVSLSIAALGTNGDTPRELLQAAGQMLDEIKAAEHERASRPASEARNERAVLRLVQSEPGLAVRGFGNEAGSGSPSHT